MLCSRIMRLEPRLQTGHTHTRGSHPAIVGESRDFLRANLNERGKERGYV